MNMKVLTLKELLIEQDRLLTIQRNILRNAINVENNKRIEFQKEIEKIDSQLELLKELINKLTYEEELYD